MDAVGTAIGRQRNFAKIASPQGDNRVVFFGNPNHFVEMIGRTANGRPYGVMWKLSDKYQFTTPPAAVPAAAGFPLSGRSN